MRCLVRALLVLLVVSYGSVRHVLAAETADEQASPALRKPLPVLAVPADGVAETPVFSTEAPPPPPFDPNYQPPAPGDND